MKGKYRAYPEYSDSETEWLGDIPSSWTVLRGKFVFKEHNERSKTGEETLLSVSEYYGVKPRSEAIGEDEFLSRAESLVDYKKCSKDDLVMNIMLAWKRGLGVTQFEGIVSPAYSVFRFNKKALPEYMHYLLRTDLYIDHFRTRSTGVIDSRLRLYPDSFADVSILLPPIIEQQKIAAFLDYETIKIDALIEKQQQLIKLLQEKRQAVISHAVTKGLNPDAPMRDSGVEWLGEVPKHWGVGSLRWYLSISSGEFLSNKKFEITKEPLCSIPVLGGNGVMGYTNAFNEVDGLIIGRVGALCGNVHHISEPSWVTDNALKVRLDRRMIPEYAKLYLDSLNLNRLANHNAQPLITGSIVKDQIATIPPEGEQKLIVNMVFYESKRIEELLSRAGQAIELMRERRTALISAAVTGKIDVCDWQPKNAVNKEIAA